MRGASTPNPEVVELVLKTTMDCVRYDLTTALPLLSDYRKLLLQLSFRLNNSHVARFLSDWFARRDDPSLKQVFASAKEIAILYVACVQEHYVLLTRTAPSSSRLISSELDIANTVAAELLSTCASANQVVCANKCFDVERLAYLAKLKFVLKCVAKYVNSQEALDQCRAETHSLQRLLQRVKQLVEPTLAGQAGASATPTVFNFLIKELIRKYGNGSVKFIMGQEHIKWIG